MGKTTDSRKKSFIENIKASGGIIYVACANTGISRVTYYKWRAADPEFATAVDEVMEAQVDFVESKLMELVRNHDTTATIFYLKTKGKKRGWSERLPPLIAVNAGNGQQQPPQPQPQQRQIEAAGSKPVGDRVARRIKSRKAYIVRLLRKQGKYTPEMSMQVTLTAQLLVRTEILAAEVLSDSHRAVDVEISREGNERRTVSPKERLYLDFAQQSQKALRALGMNTDARERKTDDGELAGLLREFGDDGDSDTGKGGGRGR